MRDLYIRLGLFLALGCAAGWAVPANAANWERFRGPNGVGIAADKEIPVQWSDKEGILWKTALPGLGNSSPVVWGERIFLQSASQDGKERLLVCLNAGDGKILWSRAVPGTTARTHLKNTLASSTPATDGERVYALFWDGAALGLYAYDFQGKLIWQQSLGEYKSQHGAGASPIVFEDKVILMNDQDGTAALLAFDAKTGTPAWQVPREGFRACYSTPFLLKGARPTPELIVASTTAITSYDPRTGETNWNWKWDWKASRAPLRTVGSAIYSQGLIFAISGDGGGDRCLVAIKASGKGDVSGTPPVWEWRRTRPFPYVPTMLALGEHLYFVNDRGDAGCCEARTGKVLWIHERLSGSITASPILIDGKVYTISEDGTASVFEAGPTFKLLGKNQMGEDVRATPAVADNRLYIRGAHHLFCIGKPRTEARTQR